VVAILTLEVTGIPELSYDRNFPWPKPRFVELLRPRGGSSHVFEVRYIDAGVNIALFSSLFTTCY
jgi:hypothetical protein